MSACASWSLRNLDAADAAATWRTIKGFVTFLVERYELAELVPPCWWQHGALTEELIALWASWSAAYLDEGVSPDAPLIWHERFATCRQRIAEWDRGGCAQHGHRESPKTAWAIDEDAYGAFIAADLAARPGQHRLALLLNGSLGAEDEEADEEGDEPC